MNIYLVEGRHWSVPNVRREACATMSLARLVAAEMTRSMALDAGITDPVTTRNWRGIMRRVGAPASRHGAYVEISTIPFHDR